MPRGPAGGLALRQEGADPLEAVQDALTLLLLLACCWNVCLSACFITLYCAGFICRKLHKMT